MLAGTLTLYPIEADGLASVNLQLPVLISNVLRLYAPANMLEPEPWVPPRALPWALPGLAWRRRVLEPQAFPLEPTP